MTFTSLSYFFFLAPVWLVFYCAKDRFRWLVLLLASYGFYFSFKAPQLPIVLALVTAVSYACGVRLGRATDEKQRRRIFWQGTGGCVAILALVKYLPPLASTLGTDLKQHHASLLVSIGVSYFTFQAISYLADIYLEIQEPEEHLGYHALSLAFFPKLLQGPIERAGDLLPQLKRPYAFDYDAVRSGMLLFAWGLFKKMVVADRLALFVNQVYGDVHSYSGLPLVIATYAYALQIYFDFAGYTDMARGTARLFGIDLSENFNAPYLATSIADFWRRWHMSFSRWILDYIFKPLQMGWRDHGQAGTALALIVTFLVSGVWHGASWGFVAWGLLHGIYLAASTYYRPYQKRLHKWLGIGKSRWLKVWQVFVTFNMVSFAWIFFRANSLEDGLYVARNLFSIGENYGDLLRLGVAGFADRFVLMGKSGYEFIYCIAALLIAAAVFNARDAFDFYNRPAWLRWSLYHLLFVVILLFQQSDNSFIYFRF